MAGCVSQVLQLHAVLPDRQGKKKSRDLHARRAVYGRGCLIIDKLMEAVHVRLLMSCIDSIRTLVTCDWVTQGLQCLLVALQMRLMCY
jgi:hypothetical protein